LDVARILCKARKSRLSQIMDTIEWAPIRRVLEEMYDNKCEKGGRPNCDVILKFKILILQQWYGLSYLEVERQMADRISFMAFLGFPDSFPDSRTTWLFRERMPNRCGTLKFQSADRVNRNPLTLINIKNTVAIIFLTSKFFFCLTLNMRKSYQDL
jgi:hypothetical protein